MHHHDDDADPGTGPETGRDTGRAPDLTLRDIVGALERLWPVSSAAEWDRVGLVTGELDQPVRRILFALDPTLAVIEEARDWGADLLVTHHPLLLRGVHSVATTSAKGASVTGLVRAGCALYVAHTNADVADPGVSTVIADALGLTEQRPLSDLGGYAAGRVGVLAEPLSLADFADLLVDALPATAGGVRVSGPPAATVRTVAVMGGSGDDQFDAARASGADVYVTADLRHHPVLEAREEARDGTPFIIDAGHWAMESLWLATARKQLLATLGEDAGEGPSAGAEPTRVEGRLSGLRTEPWTFVAGANRARPEPGGVS
ncbi:dinuclear metal center YbgI/SA1388 family protein [Humibacillus xanthopallidus]|uniref:GTP cyclohydrolase 1 type 2 homolog n=1 Tax=Humibacillus xanthopallidus TaxID=412689 RepID=A0A543PTQ1_9MICO|nr:Nif3-like dinuclear metal center hexameric protein [Humibacillus xanthopallidus]TQN47426.1 dinuclear metal center YbgI/SA1388 family protein [Humibacillus xanthopallidus]